MGSDIDASRFQRASEIQGDDPEDTMLLRQAHAKAVEYLRTFCWVPPTFELFLGFGIGGVVAVFLARLEGAQIDDEELWVVLATCPQHIWSRIERWTPVKLSKDTAN